MTSIKLNDISHRRFNPFTNSWVLLASLNKNNRPRQGRKEASAFGGRQAHDPQCYLYPGNQRANGVRNPNYADTFLFENDYSTMRMDEGRCDTKACEKHLLRDTAADLMRAEAVIGRCYVLTYSVNHHHGVSNMTCQQVLGVVEAWTETSTSMKCHEMDSRLESSLDIASRRYMQIFDNNGEIVGCSNAHPYSQIWITSSIPDEPQLEHSQMNKYHDEHHGRHMLQDYVELEIEREERIILLLPKRQIRGLVDLNTTERLEFARAILQIARIYDNLFGTTWPYISAIHQAPLDATEAELKTSYLHAHFSSPLLSPSIKKFFGGYELYGEPTREITPEFTAACLRHSAAQLTVPLQDSTATDVRI
ncbi:galactose-1-phosphate uridyl transferase [Tothia fuscella]|uniref:Galactose-1-phosphate uridylyltransferase n=1 Tax=Tothia fuscella TaxID=1048955 RepID=A0A9P4TU65_9PEZI|nr:galactose-1-phosphate uridyl transferase [Tothia fuscella]